MPMHVIEAVDNENLLREMTDEINENTLPFIGNLKVCEHPC